MKRICAVVLASMLGLFVASGAHATIITATFEGIGTFNAYGSSPTLGTPQIGDAVEMKFTFDTSMLGPVNGPDFNSAYGDFYGGNSGPNVYSAITVSFGGGPALPVLISNGQTSLGLGDQTKIFEDFYYNAANNGIVGVQAYFYNYSGGTTNLDPAQTFSYAIQPTDTQDGGFQLYDGTNIIGIQTVHWSSVLVTADVPAPGALVLLGFGLVGLGGLRRKSKTL